MTRLREIIHVQVECSDEAIPAALAQAANIDKGILPMVMPAMIRQVFYELPASSQIALQLPNMVVQKTALLEHNNGEVRRHDHS